jgi:hypothetical protein
MGRIGPDPAERCQAIRNGMSREQVRSVLGQPSYIEEELDWLGLSKGRQQDVYPFSVVREHFCFYPVVIACNRTGAFVRPEADEYKVIVRYDEAGRVSKCESVSGWSHPDTRPVGNTARYPD